MPIEKLEPNGYVDIDYASKINEIIDVVNSRPKPILVVYYPKILTLEESIKLFQSYETHHVAKEYIILFIPEIRTGINYQVLSPEKISGEELVEVINISKGLLTRIKQEVKNENKRTKGSND